MVVVPVEQIAPPLMFIAINSTKEMYFCFVFIEYAYLYPIQHFPLHIVGGTSDFCLSSLGAEMFNNKREIKPLGTQWRHGNTYNHLHNSVMEGQL